MTANILAVGDVVGRPGLDFIGKHLRSLKNHYGIDFTVVNGENAAGTGITPQQAEEIFTAGADVITLGNHTWNRKEIEPYLDDCRYILRPENYAPQVPGRGWGVFETDFGDVCVMNLIGRCDMEFGPDNPFFAADRVIAACGTKIVLVDMHCEATSEKLAMGYYLDGRVSALWGTHTHVQTSDACILPGGTGYITDLGMTGPEISVIGIKPEQSVSMFLGNPRRPYSVAQGRAKLECCVFGINTDTGMCLSAEALRIR